MADAFGEISPAARQHLRRNFSLGVMNGVVYSLSDTLMDATLVMTWFLSQLGASSLLIGLIAPVRSGGWFFPQLLVSGYVQRQERKIVLYRLCAVLRALSIIAFAISIWLLRGSNQQLLIILFFVCILLLSVGEGISGPSFMDIVAKTVPARRRGGFFALRAFLGGIMALSSGLIVRYVLAESSPFAFPANFGILFSLAAVGMAISATSFSLVAEPVEPTDRTVVPFTAQLARAWRFMREDHNFRQLILVRTLLVFGGGLATPFYIVYAREVLHAPARNVGSYLLSFTLASIVANVLWGRLSTRYGNRLVIVASALLGLCVPLSAFLAGRAGSLLLFFLPFVLRGAYESSVMVGHTNFVLDIAPAMQRPTYIGLINTVLGIASFALMANGVIVGVLGYEVLFGVTMTFFVLGFFASLKLYDPLGRAARIESAPAGAQAKVRPQSSG